MRFQFTLEETQLIKRALETHVWAVKKVGPQAAKAARGEECAALLKRVSGILEVHEPREARRA